MNRGVSSAFTLAHADAGTYCYGFHSVTSSQGFASKYVDLADFNPTDNLKGGSIRCLMKRYASGDDYAPMMGLIRGTDPATAEGYLLGLTQGSSYQVALKKGTPSAGLSASSSEVLDSSTSAFSDVGDSQAAWWHLRMDILVNPHGEVIINVYENDVQNNGLAAGGGSESWVAIDGIDQFIDDPAGVFSGSVPHTGQFYFVFGMYTEAAGSIALFDHIECMRQTAP